MQFIKPTYVQRLLKLRTPEDIVEWREERKLNFPTRSKREAQQTSTELNLNESDHAQQFNRSQSRNNNKFQHNKPNNNRHNQGRFNKANHNSRHAHKRPFHNEARNQQQTNEPNAKEAKTSGHPPTIATEEESDRQADGASEVNHQNSNQQHTGFKRRRHPTLLEKMLLTDARRNEDAIFKCIELIVQSNYLNDDRTDQSGDQHSEQKVDSNEAKLDKNQSEQSDDSNQAHSTGEQSNVSNDDQSGHKSDLNKVIIDTNQSEAKSS